MNNTFVIDKRALTSVYTNVYVNVLRLQLWTELYSCVGIYICTGVEK